MKKTISYVLALAWSVSVVAMEQPVPSAPPFEPEAEMESVKVFVPGAPSAPPAEDLGVSPEELKRTSQPPTWKSEIEKPAPWQQPNVSPYAPSFAQPMEQPAPPIEQPWYQRYWNRAKTTWNTTKAIAQTSWSWLKPAAVGAAKGSWSLIKLGASGVASAARLVNRKINYD